MKEKTPIPRMLCTTVVLVCILEIIAVGYLFRSSPPPPPEIQSYQTESDLKDQAQKIFHEHFSGFPEITKHFYGIFYFYNAEQACKDIIKPTKYWHADIALKSYNLYAHPLNSMYPLNFILLLSVLSVCLVLSIFITFSRHVFVPALIIVFSSLMTLPEVSGSISAVSNWFLFYWTLPPLLFALIVLILFGLGWSFNFRLGSSQKPLSPGSDLFASICIIIFSGLVAAASIAASKESGARIIVGAPIALSIYGLFRFIRALFGLVGFHGKRYTRLASDHEEVKTKSGLNFICPDCSTRSLQIVVSMELGPDRDFDETAIQAMQCNNCGILVGGIYLESRRGAGSSWQHVGYKVPKGEHDVLVSQLRQCPTPSDYHCECEIHKHFSDKQNGSLHPLSKFKYDPEDFDIVI